MNVENVEEIGCDGSAAAAAATAAAATTTTASVSAAVAAKILSSQCQSAACSSMIVISRKADDNNDDIGAMEVVANAEETAAMVTDKQRIQLKTKTATNAQQAANTKIAAATTTTTKATASTSTTNTNEAFFVGGDADDAMIDIDEMMNWCRSCGKPNKELYDLFTKNAKEGEDVATTKATTTTTAAATVATAAATSRIVGSTKTLTNADGNINNNQNAANTVAITKTVATTAKTTTTAHNSCPETTTTTSAKSSNSSSNIDVSAATNASAKLTAQGQNSMENIVQEMQIWQLRIKPNDGLPQRICPKCTAQFYMIHKFRRKCLKVQIRLRELYGEQQQRRCHDDELMDDAMMGVGMIGATAAATTAATTAAIGVEQFKNDDYFNEDIGNDSINKNCRQQKQKQQQQQATNSVSHTNDVIKGITKELEQEGVLPTLRDNGGDAFKSMQQIVKIEKNLTDARIKNLSRNLELTVKKGIMQATEGGVLCSSSSTETSLPVRSGSNLNLSVISNSNSKCELVKEDEEVATKTAVEIAERLSAATETDAHLPLNDAALSAQQLNVPQSLLIEKTKLEACKQNETCLLRSAKVRRKSLTTTDITGISAMPATPMVIVPSQSLANDNEFKSLNFVASNDKKTAESEHLMSSTLSVNEPNIKQRLNEDVSNNVDNAANNFNDNGLNISNTNNNNNSRDSFEIGLVTKAALKDYTLLKNEMMTTTPATATSTQVPQMAQVQQLTTTTGTTTSTNVVDGLAVSCSNTDFVVLADKDDDNDDDGGGVLDKSILSKYEGRLSLTKCEILHKEQTMFETTISRDDFTNDKPLSAIEHVRAGKEVNEEPPTANNFASSVTKDNSLFSGTLNATTPTTTTTTQRLPQTVQTEETQSTLSPATCASSSSSSTSMLILSTNQNVDTHQKMDKLLNPEKMCSSSGSSKALELLPSLSSSSSYLVDPKRDIKYGSSSSNSNFDLTVGMHEIIRPCIVRLQRLHLDDLKPMKDRMNLDLVEEEKMLIETSRTKYCDNEQEQEEENEDRIEQQLNRKRKAKGVENIVLEQPQIAFNDDDDDVADNDNDEANFAENELKKVKICNTKNLELLIGNYERKLTWKTKAQMKEEGLGSNKSVLVVKTPTNTNSLHEEATQKDSRHKTMDETIKTNELFATHADFKSSSSSSSTMSPSCTVMNDELKSKTVTTNDAVVNADGETTVTTVASAKVISVSEDVINDNNKATEQLMQQNEQQQQQQKQVLKQIRQQQQDDEMQVKPLETVMVDAKQAQEPKLNALKTVKLIIERKRGRRYKCRHHNDDEQVVGATTHSHSQSTQASAAKRLRLPLEHNQTKPDEIPNNMQMSGRSEDKVLSNETRTKTHRSQKHTSGSSSSRKRKSSRDLIVKIPLSSLTDEFRTSYLASKSQIGEKEVATNDAVETETETFRVKLSANTVKATEDAIKITTTEIKADAETPIEAPEPSLLSNDLLTFQNIQNHSHHQPSSAQVQQILLHHPNNFQMLTPPQEMENFCNISLHSFDAFGNGNNNTNNNNNAMTTTSMSTTSIGNSSNNNLNAFHQHHHHHGSTDSLPIVPSPLPLVPPHSSDAQNLLQNTPRSMNNDTTPIHNPHEMSPFLGFNSSTTAQTPLSSCDDNCVQNSLETLESNPPSVQEQTTNDGVRGDGREYLASSKITDFINDFQAHCIDSSEVDSDEQSADMRISMDVLESYNDQTLLPVLSVQQQQEDEEEQDGEVEVEQQQEEFQPEQEQEQQQPEQEQKQQQPEQEQQQQQPKQEQLQQQQTQEQHHQPTETQEQQLQDQHQPPPPPPPPPQQLQQQPPQKQQSLSEANLSEMQDVETTLNGILNEMQDQHIYTPVSTHTDDFLSQTICSPLTDPPVTPTNSMYAESPVNYNMQQDSSPYTLPSFQQHHPTNNITTNTATATATNSNCSSSSNSTNQMSNSMTQPQQQEQPLHGTDVFASNFNATYDECFTEESSQADLIAYQNNIPCFENIELASSASSTPPRNMQTLHASEAHDLLQGTPEKNPPVVVRNQQQTHYMGSSCSSRNTNGNNAGAQIIGTQCLVDNSSMNLVCAASTSAVENAGPLHTPTFPPATMGGSMLSQGSSSSCSVGGMRYATTSTELVGDKEFTLDNATAVQLSQLLQDLQPQHQHQQQQQQQQHNLQQHQPHLLHLQHQQQQNQFVPHSQQLVHQQHMEGQHSLTSTAVAIDGLNVSLGNRPTMYTKVLSSCNGGNNNAGGVYSTGNAQIVPTLSDDLHPQQHLSSHSSHHQQHHHHTQQHGHSSLRSGTKLQFITFANGLDSQLTTLPDNGTQMLTVGNTRLNLYTNVPSQSGGGGGTTAAIQWTGAESTAAVTAAVEPQNATTTTTYYVNAADLYHPNVNVLHANVSANGAITSATTASQETIDNSGNITTLALPLQQQQHHHQHQHHLNQQTLQALDLDKCAMDANENYIEGMQQQQQHQQQHQQHQIIQGQSHQIHLQQHQPQLQHPQQIQQQQQQQQQHHASNLNQQPMYIVIPHELLRESASTSAAAQSTSQVYATTSSGDLNSLTLSQTAQGTVLLQTAASHSDGRTHYITTPLTSPAPTLTPSPRPLTAHSPAPALIPSPSPSPLSGRFMSPIKQHLQLRLQQQQQQQQQQPAACQQAQQQQQQPSRLTQLQQEQIRHLQRRQQLQEQLALQQRQLKERVQQKQQQQLLEQQQRQQRKLQQQKDIERMLQNRKQQNQQQKSATTQSQSQSQSQQAPAEKVNLTCRFCHKRPKFTNNLDYSNHIIENHPVDTPYNCPHCPTYFKKRAKRQQHILDEHSNRSFKCAQCGQGFCAQRTLDLHLQRHHAPEVNPTTPTAATAVSQTSTQSQTSYARFRAAWAEGKPTPLGASAAKQAKQAPSVRVEDVHLQVSEEGKGKKAIDLELDASQMAAVAETSAATTSTSTTTATATSSSCSVTNATTTTPATPGKPQRILCCPDCDESGESHSHNCGEDQSEDQQEKLQEQQQQLEEAMDEVCKETQEDEYKTPHKPSTTTMTKSSSEQQQQQQQQPLPPTAIQPTATQHVTMPSPEQTEPDSTSTTTLRQFRKRRTSAAKIAAAAAAAAAGSVDGNHHDDDDHHHQQQQQKQDAQKQQQSSQHAQHLQHSQQHQQSQITTLRSSHNCLFCEERFTNEISLRKHHQLAHSNQNTLPFVCSICKRGYRMRSALQRHMETHDAEGRPYECNFCHVRFPRPSQLTLHKLSVHFLKKPHTCDECGKQFGTESALKTHFKFHGARSVECDICGQMFYLKKDMRKHRRIHTGERFYNCDFCPSTFLHYTRLMAHIKTHLPLGVFMEDTAPILTAEQKVQIQQEHIQQQLQQHQQQQQQQQQEQEVKQEVKEEEQLESPTSEMKLVIKDENSLAMEVDGNGDGDGVDGGDDDDINQNEALQLEEATTTSTTTTTQQAEEIKTEELASAAAAAVATSSSSLSPESSLSATILPMSASTTTVTTMTESMSQNECATTTTNSAIKTTNIDIADGIEMPTITTTVAATPTTTTLDNLDDANSIECDRTIDEITAQQQEEKVAPQTIVTQAVVTATATAAPPPAAGYAILNTQ